MNKFIHHEGRLNNNMQKWKKEKEKEKKIIIIYNFYLFCLYVFVCLCYIYIYIYIYIYRPIYLLQQLCASFCSTVYMLPGNWTLTRRQFSGLKDTAEPAGLRLGLRSDLG